MAADRSQHVLELVRRPGNNVCADCSMPEPQWASWNIGVFLCESCAGIHRSLGAHISKIKSIRLDKWNEDQLQVMEALGNLKAKEKYEVQVPACYRIPTCEDVQVLREQWIRAKYERQEFMDIEKQTYLAGMKEGFLWKKGKDDSKFQSRKFILSEADNCIKYFRNVDSKDPKAVIRLDDLNAVFVPEKIGNLNGLQLTYNKDGSTRNLFVYKEEGKEIVDWYTSIRSCKLNRRCIAFPEKSVEQLSNDLTSDFIEEGWLHKTGPRIGDAFRKRWFTLDQRRLMYYADPLDAFAKGEVFIGHKDNGYRVKMGVPPGCKDMGFSFTLCAPDRDFHLSAETDRIRDNWIRTLRKVTETPLSVQESSSKKRFNFK